MQDIQDKEFYIQNRWRNLGDISKIDIRGPLYYGLFIGEQEMPIHLFNTMYNPEYFTFLCRHFFNVELLPFQALILQELWVRPFPMLIGSRGMSKSFLLGLYALLRSFLLQGTNTIIVGSAFRQSKQVFEYTERIWNDSPILKDICKEKGQFQGPRKETDKWTLNIGDSKVIAIPIGTGDKIRGLRANCVIADEFAAQSKEIFEVVVKGFGVVSRNPVESTKRYWERLALQELGEWDDQDEKQYKMNSFNQSILSGTADYSFNHFADYWKKWRTIVNSRGDAKKLVEIFPEGVPDGFDWKDYSVMRIPYELLPPKFMDDKQVSSAKASVHKSNYLREYAAVFPNDSDGFYKRSLIETCVANTDNVSNLNRQNPEITSFSATLRGRNGLRYVYGIDPASQVDKFAIVILEVHPSHRRIVYVWTMDKKKYREIYKNKGTSEQDYFAFCGKKIRELMKVFPPERIGIDTQGGGYQMEETLHDNDKMAAGEQPLWQVIDKDKPKDSDLYAGLHILEMIQFANAEWTSNANHGMKKDFEDKALIFPEFNPAVIGLALEEDASNLRTYDTLEDAIMEIEQLKDELCTIVHTRTGTQGRDRWDTPEEKLAGGKKGRQRKDRYSALLIANMIGRTLQRKIEQKIEIYGGGFAGQISMENDGSLYSGPDWWVRGMGGV